MFISLKAASVLLVVYKHSVRLRPNSKSSIAGDTFIVDVWLVVYARVKISRSCHAKIRVAALFSQASGLGLYTDFPVQDPVLSWLKSAAARINSEFFFAKPRERDSR